MSWDFIRRKCGQRPATGDFIRRKCGQPDAAFGLVSAVEGLAAGDHLFFTDWRGDPDLLMRPDGPTVAELFSAAVRRGVVVKGLMWRSYSDKMGYSEEESRHLGDEVEAAGGEVLLDQRVRRAGSHHQKLVVLRHVGRPHKDVAFAGGIDLCHGRRDDAEHGGDPRAGWSISRTSTCGRPSGRALRRRAG
ncbi:MAG: hypothetical protein ACR2JG_13815 [Geodermatophilaceae bacterium]